MESTHENLTLKQNRRNGICYICAKRKAVNKDHIPPNCLFPLSFKNRNVRKITVWSCEECRKEYEKIDHEIRDYLSLASFSPYKDELWAKTKRKLQKSPKLRTGIIKKMISVERTHIPGKYIKEGATKAVKLPKSYGKFIKRLFKGFHTHFARVVVDESYEVNIWEYPIEDLPSHLKFVNVKYYVEGVITLLGAVSLDHKLSLWWLELHNNPYYICAIAPKSIFLRAK